MLTPIKVKNQPTSMAWDGLDPGLGHKRPRRSQQEEPQTRAMAPFSGGQHEGQCHQRWHISLQLHGIWAPHTFTFTSVWLLYEHGGPRRWDKVVLSSQSRDRSGKFEVASSHEKYEPGPLVASTCSGLNRMTTGPAR